MREWFANIIVICLSAAFLYHFSLIAVRGTVTIQEPNTWILGLEIAGMVGFIIFAIFNLVSLTRRK